MLEQAKQQRDGIILDVPPEPPKAKAKPQGPGKVPKTREQLFAEMQKLKELAGGDQITAAKSGAMRFGGKKAFFNWIFADEEVALARGGGGGLALWRRDSEMEASA